MVRKRKPAISSAATSANEQHPEQDAADQKDHVHRSSPRDDD
jgi:hypothetical protein